MIDSELNNGSDEYEIIEERPSEDPSWEMWFGILIGASLVMLVVLCSLCVIFLVRKRVPPKDFVETSHGTFGQIWDRSIDEYEVSQMKIIFSQINHRT